MDTGLRALVRQRAGNRCEYCRIHQDDDPYLPFHVEHIIARQHGGTDKAGNFLALSCNHCNACKGPNLSGIDPRSSRLIRLFHPRRHNWDHHFRWNGPFLVGQTPIGRVTIAVLQINHPDRLALRQALIDAGLFPP